MKAVTQSHQGITFLDDSGDPVGFIPLNLGSMSMDLTWITAIVSEWTERGQLPAAAHEGQIPQNIMFWFDEGGEA